MAISRALAVSKPLGGWLGLLVLSAFLLAIAVHSPDYRFDPAFYVPLHTAMHVFSLVVAWLVFAVGWNTQDARRAGTVTVLACGFLAVALLDFGHALSYSGMPDFFTPASPQKAISFSLFSRSLAAVALLLLAFSLWRPLPARHRRYVYLAVSMVFTITAYWMLLWRPHWFPLTYVAGEGLTVFKTSVEFVLAAVHVLAAGGFLHRWRRTGSTQWAYLLAASLMMAMSQLLNAVYFDPFDIHNFLSHLYRVVGYALIYRGLFLSEIREPFQRVERLQDELRQSAERLRDMGARAQSDIEAERKRIAQALHDDMGQNLTVLRMDVDWIQRHCQDDITTMEAAERMRERIEECALSMRRIVADLRPRVLDDLGIVAAAKGLIAEVSKRSGLDIRFEPSAVPESLNDATQTALYRILQESLTNITRHAVAHRVRVALAAEQGDLTMRIEDDGIGFDVARPRNAASLGLFGMSERAHQLGGTCQVHSSVGRGAQVVVRLPMSALATTVLSPDAPAVSQPGIARTDNTTHIAPGAITSRTRNMSGRS